MAAVALPIGVAYSDLVGVPAVYGIYSAIFPLLAYALFGSSRQLIVGPDAATCMMVAASLAVFAGGDPGRYLSLMVAMTLLTGALLVIAGFFRLGFIANFLSQPILTGYLNGTALIIMVGQLPKLLGIKVEAGGFFPKVAELTGKLDQTHLPTLALGGGMLVVLVALKKLAPSLPGALIVVVAGGVAVVALNLQNLGIAVIGTVPSGLPTLHFTLFDASTSATLLRDAVGIGLSLIWLLMVGSKPSQEILGEVTELGGFYSIDRHPDATQVPRLLVYRFNASLVFFNADVFRDGLRAKIDAATEPVEWVVVDAGPFNVLDATALGKMDDLRAELSDRGIVLTFAGVKSELKRFFKAEWTKNRFADVESFNFPTIEAAVAAFRERNDG